MTDRSWTTKWKTQTTAFGKGLKVAFHWGFIPLIISLAMGFVTPSPSLISMLLPLSLPPPPSPLDMPPA